MNETKQVALLCPTDKKNRSITNFLVHSPRGTIFIRSLNTSSIHKNVGQLFTLLDSIMDEIGEENVVQIATDSPSAYVAAEKMLMEKKKKKHNCFGILVLHIVYITRGVTLGRFLDTNIRCQRQKSLCLYL